MRLAVFFVALAAVVPTAQAQTPASAALICRPTVKHVCDADGCKPQPLTVFNVVDVQRSTYGRCDKNGCDTYDARITRSGVFTNVSVEGRGLLAKLDDGGAFVEVVTLGTTALISHGQCSRKP